MIKAALNRLHRRLMPILMIIPAHYFRLRTQQDLHAFAFHFFRL